MNDQKVFVEVQMMIRKPAEEVFNAFIDPAITTKFWFTKSTGRLESGQTVTWTWEMYGVSTEVNVIDIVAGRSIKVKWGDPATTIDFLFEPIDRNFTRLVIKNYGFTATGDDLMKEINDNTGGFTTVVDGAKAFLEHGIELNLIADKFYAGSGDEGAVS